MKRGDDRDSTLGSGTSIWPELRYEDWRDTCQTFHRWAQIIGKIRLSKSPWVNHTWNSTLYVSARGLTTGVIHDGAVSFSLELDLVNHVLRIVRSDNAEEQIVLLAEPVSNFYSRCMSSLKKLGIETNIYGRPNELPDVTPFSEDQVHRSYDAEAAHRFHQILLQCDRVMKEFRSRFLGKCSPVQFFWGGLDIAVTRFSGRRAPEHPGGIPHLPDLVTRESYSHELSSCGFWPGNDLFPRAAFYSYAYPLPPGFESAKIPKGAFFEPKLREFILPYEEVRGASSPDELVLEFLQKTYEAAADLGKWDRELLEESPYLAAIQAERKRQRSAKRAA